MKARIKFQKMGPVRFIGHLDLMRTMQKAFRRAAVPIAYSHGYNPHQVLSFASPLPVGVESLCDYMDLELERDVDLHDMVVDLNNTLPLGLFALEARELEEGEAAGMAAVTGSKYIVIVHDSSFTHEMVDTFLKKEEVTYMKKNKRGKLNEVDIRPGIYEIIFDGKDLLIQVSAGSVMNIKPETVVEQLCISADLPYNRHNYHYIRQELILS